MRTYNAFYRTTSDGKSIYIRHWDAPNTKAVVMIAHGLAETADYYEEFAEAAVAQGFAVYANEARGHGRTAGDVTSDTYQGGDAGTDGILHMAEDLFALTKIIRECYPDAPIFLLGHSMGAIVAQLFVRKYENTLAGLVLTGIPSIANIEELLETVGKEIIEVGLKVPSVKTMLSMFQDVNTQFAPVKTELDWITSDESKIQECLRLPYTNIPFSNEFYRDFLLAVKETQDETFWGAITPDFPVLLLWGEQDVIANRGEYALTKYRQLLDGGARAVQYRVYPGLRHSILQESGRTAVTQDILAWLSQQRLFRCCSGTNPQL